MGQGFVRIAPQHLHQPHRTGRQNPVDAGLGLIVQVLLESFFAKIFVGVQRRADGGNQIRSLGHDFPSFEVGPIG